MEVESYVSAAVDGPRFTANGGLSLVDLLGIGRRLEVHRPRFGFLPSVDQPRSREFADELLARSFSESKSLGS